MYSTSGPWSMLSFPHCCLRSFSLCGVAHLAEIEPFGVFQIAGLCGSLGDSFAALFWLFWDIPEARKRMIGRLCSVYFKFSINYQIPINSCYWIHNFNWYWILGDLDKFPDAYQLCWYMICWYLTENPKKKFELILSPLTCRLHQQWQTAQAETILEPTST